MGEWPVAGAAAEQARAGITALDNRVVDGLEVAHAPLSRSRHESASTTPSRAERGPDTKPFHDREASPAPTLLHDAAHQVRKTSPMPPPRPFRSTPDATQGQESG